jgi:hypothetical protein
MALLLGMNDTSKFYTARESPSGADLKIPALTRRYDLTTKRTKNTKDSEIVIFEFLNFVLFVTFVVNCLFLLWLPRAALGPTGKLAR